MGGGDWNDGMNRVGHEGRGESVWLAWFLIYVLKKFAPVVRIPWRLGVGRGLPGVGRAPASRRGGPRRGMALGITALTSTTARRSALTPPPKLESTRSRRRGRPSPAPPSSERAATALESVEEKLVRREDRLIALLTPPFDHMLQDPGYIKGYVPGVRENGGQYTHGALWVVLAHLMRGDGDDAAGLLSLINPIASRTQRRRSSHYAVEPYVVAADIYAAPPHVGRGGWTWYTGSASWFYRVAVEWMLGLRIVTENGKPSLVVDPCIPKSGPVSG